jgi:hypothetical protein
MGKWTKIAIGTGIVAAIGGGIAYVMRLNRLAEELVVVPTVMLHKVDLTGIWLRVDVVLKNPTRAKVKMNFPFIKLLYKDAVIGSSQAVSKEITIPKYGETVINAIMIQIPLMGVFSLGSEILSAIQSQSPIKLGVRTLTTIDLGWKKFPYEDTQEYTFKAPKIGS